MNWYAWRPRRPQRMALVGLLGTGVMVPVFALDVARSGGDLRSFAVVVPLALLVLAAVIAWWRGLHTREVDLEVTLSFYTWSALGTAALTSVVAAAGGDPRRYGLIFGAMVATQAAVYPLRGQLVLLPLNASAYLGLLAYRGIAAPDILIQMGMFLVLSFLVSSVAGNLHATYDAEARARILSETRARLAAAIASVTSIDPAEVHAAIVEGTRELGFAVAYLGLLDGGRLRVAAAANVRGAAAFDLDQSIAGVALEQGATVTTPDQAATGVGATAGAAIAVPIRDVDRVVGVVYAATVETGALPDEIVQTVEAFAAQAGRALSIARLYAQEREAVERLTELDAMKGAFLTNVSHELRTPLTVIRGLGETMVGRWGDFDGEDALLLLQRVNANSERLEAMIRGLLDFSRFDAGAAEVHLVPTNVADLGRRVLDRMQPLLEEREVEVDLEEVLVDVDPPMLEHVLENLIGNALRYTPEGTPIALLGRAGPAGVRVTVADDGPGVAEDDLPHVTDRFYRGGDSNDRPAGGLGLGLSLCVQILQAHGSQLEVESPEGSGARFSFWLRPAEEVRVIPEPERESIGMRAGPPAKTGPAPA